MKRIISMFAVASLALATMTGIHAQTKKETVNLSDLPKAVQKTITEHSAGGTVDKIEKETEGGKFVCYTVSVKKGDKTDEFYVGEDGKYLGKEKPGDTSQPKP